MHRDFKNNVAIEMFDRYKDLKHMHLEEGSDDLKLYFEEVKRKTNLNYKTIPDRFMQFYETLG